MNTTQSELAALRAKHAEMGNQIASLEASINAKPITPWEPKGGEFFHRSQTGTVEKSDSDEGSRKNGCEYPTRKAAESALPYVTFFKRLCCLAAELNPSGKVGGNFYVFPPRHGDVSWKPYDWDVEGHNDRRDITCVFETHDAALKACEIMNRDGWKVPSL